ncbi:MAG: transglycosylase SLT domain-containing protein [Alphaproteobacteria bacterium]|nr:transglycosylase SLT domain-containing protein [Alphaproteobacteria bacterium]
MQYFSQKYKALVKSALLFCAVIAALISNSPSAALGDTLTKTDAAHYRAAFKAAHSGKWSEAERRAARAKNPLPAKALAWLRYKTVNSGADFTAIDRFLRANAAWPHQFDLRRNAELTMRNVLSDDAAIAWFEKNPPLTTAGSARYASALIAKGRKAEAIAFVRETWRELRMNRAEERNFRRQFRKLLRTEDNIARLDRLIWDQQVSSARRQMRRVGRDHQHLALARLALMRRTGGVDGAIARVPESLRDHPGLVYERLRWRRRKGFSDSAVELLLNPPAQLERPGKWWLERAILARRALRDGDITQAYRLVNDHRQTDGAPHAEAEWLAGWIALRFLGDYDVAQQHFKRLYGKVQYPVSRARGAYWTGRAIEANIADVENRSAKAAIWYRNAAQYATTFYGQLAIDRLRQNRVKAPPQEPTPSPAETRAFEKREMVRLVRILATLGEDKLLGDFISGLSKAAESPAEWALIARLAVESGRNDLAIKVAKAAIRNGIALTEAGYPKLTVNKNFSVGPALVHAVIRQESLFNPRAISSAGARGLMQLMPATAKLVARQLKLRHTKQRLISDPLHNLSLGSAYLRQLHDYYDSSLILTLAAYNAGPGNVNRWLRMNGDPRDFSTLEAIDWIEAIPIPETRNYVQRVLENLTIYGYRFEDSFLPSMIIDAMIGSDTVDYP